MTGRILALFFVFCLISYIIVVNVKKEMISKYKHQEQSMYGQPRIFTLNRISYLHKKRVNSGAIVWFCKTDYLNEEFDIIRNGVGNIIRITNEETQLKRHQIKL